MSLRISLPRNLWPCSEHHSQEIDHMFRDSSAVHVDSQHLHYGLFKIKIRNHSPKPKLKHKTHMFHKYMFQNIIYTYQMKSQQQLLLQGELWTKPSKFVNKQTFLQFLWFLLNILGMIYLYLAIYICLYIHVNSNWTYLILIFHNNLI